LKSVTCFLCLGISFIFLLSCQPSVRKMGTAYVTIDCAKITDGSMKPLVSTTYLLSFSGPLFMQDVAMSENTAWVTLPAGKWTVTARAIDHSKRDIAAGTVSMVEVERGKTSPVSIALN
jgi:hypothetical protein